MSGYSDSERLDFIKGAINIYEKIRGKVETGEFISMNRDRKEMLSMKEAKGGRPSRWFHKGYIVGTIATKVTLYSCMKHNISKMVKKNRENDKMIVI